MPVRGRDKVDEESRQSWFSHQSEEARPYYYSVYLADHDIKAEIAPTERAAIMRFTFPESDESGVVIDAFDRGSYIRVMHDKTDCRGIHHAQQRRCARQLQELVYRALRPEDPGFPDL